MDFGGADVALLRLVPQARAKPDMLWKQSVKVQYIQKTGLFFINFFFYICCAVTSGVA